MKLTDEHIVPFSLGGGHVIEGGSCQACAKITAKIELDVARGLWGDVRAAYNAPTRRRKKRQTHISLPNPHNHPQTLRVRYSEYPAPMIFYKMDKAGVLRGMPSNVDISFAWKLVSVVDDAKLKVFETKNPGRLTARFKHVPESFARMIAKIGYGQVLTVLDPKDIRPICLPYILGQLRNVSYVVGGRLNIRDPDAGVGYVLRTGAFGTLERLMIVAEVRLIANNHTPTYHVIVGDALGRSNVVAVLAKLNASPTDLLPLHVGNLGEQPSDEHWLPSVWPLPFWSNSSVA